MDAIASVFKTNDLFSSILHYTISNAKDAPPIALTSRHWNDVLNHNPETSWKIWKQICHVQESLLTLPEYQNSYVGESFRSCATWKWLLRQILDNVRSMEAEFDEVVDCDEEQMIGNGYYSFEQDADVFDEYDEVDFEEDNDEMDF
eukprot:scaffold19800_cov58-Cyclotella_meneghiniana.AAC.8